LEEKAALPEDKRLLVLARLARIGSIGFTALAVTACGLFGGAPVATTSIPLARPAPTPYVIGRDDLLDVEVWKQKDLSGPVAVASNGDITLPLVGEVKAAGLTSDQLQKDLDARLTPLVHGPNVMVRVMDPKSCVFYVNGEVTHPGVFPLHSGEVLSQAIAEAGGLTQFADPGAVKVVRRNSEQALEIRVDYRLVQSGKDMQGDISMERDDTILVP
jgi:polysaccharide biosynthesis/export protein